MSVTNKPIMERIAIAVEITKKLILCLLIIALFIAYHGSDIYQYAFADIVFDKHDNTIGNEALDAAVDPDGDGEVKPTLNGIIEGDTVCERLVDGMSEFENYFALTGDTNVTRIIGYFHEFFENADCHIAIAIPYFVKVSIIRLT